MFAPYYLTQLKIIFYPSCITTSPFIIGDESHYYIYLILILVFGYVSISILFLLSRNNLMSINDEIMIHESNVKEAHVNLKLFFALSILNISI